MFRTLVNSLLFKALVILGYAGGLIIAGLGYGLAELTDSGILGLIGYAVVFAGIALLMLGVYATLIKAITDAVADHVVKRLK